MPETRFLHRLDKALFWVRVLFLIAAISFALMASDTVLGDQAGHADFLAAGIGAALLATLLYGALIMMPGISDNQLGIISLVVDTMLAALFFLMTDGSIVLLLLLGALAVLPAAYRFGFRGLILAALLLAAATGVILMQFEDVADTKVTDWIAGLACLGAFGLLAGIMRAGGLLTTENGVDTSSVELEAQRLRATRERTRAIYEMANTLSATGLDYRRVLEAAQNIGTMGLREMGSDSQPMSAAMLFQGDDNQLRVVNSRRLTLADQQVAVPGQRGVLGLALKQAEPVFGGDAIRDPELRYFVGFQDAKSTLVIPLRSGFSNYGVLVFGSEQPNAFSDEHVELMTAIGTQATLSLQNAVLFQNLLSEKERIVEVEEDARKKLSRDLHDGPTQSVAAIAMRVNYIRRLIERQPEQAVEELWKVEELARRTTKEIRHMLFTLRPLVLETQGLVAALGQLAEKMRETHNTEVTLKGQANVEEFLDTHAQGVLFYIVEEAVNNARKHAEAEHIWVRLYRRQNYVIVEIEDDGVGFDVGEVDSNYDQRGSLGMVNMRERAELIEGTLRIQSARGRGTKISVLVPARPGGAGGNGSDGEGPAEPLELQPQRPLSPKSPPDTPAR